jgi:hypothetical protein
VAHPISPEITVEIVTTAQVSPAQRAAYSRLWHLLLAPDARVTPTDGEEGADR